MWCDWVRKLESKNIKANKWNRLDQKKIVQKIHSIVYIYCIYILYM